MNDAVHRGLAARLLASIPSPLALAVTLLPLAGGVAAQQVAPAGSHAFVLYEFEVHDPVGFKTLAGKLRDSLKTYKGEFVMREKVSSLFGGDPSNLSVISFPDVGDARAWLASPGVAQLKVERDRVASIRTYLVEQLD